MSEAAERTRENRLRRKARRQGYLLRKSRVKTPNLDDHGGWLILDPRTNFVVAGFKFDLDLDGVEAWLEEPEGET